MLATARSVLVVGVLAIGCPLGVGAPSAQAQAPLAQAPRYSVPTPVYSHPGPRYSAPAPVYSYPAPCYYIPAPVYSYPVPWYSIPAPVSSFPARTFAYQPRPYDSYSVPSSSSSAPDDSQPPRRCSYIDQDGIEHDSRYPHWSFDTSGIPAFGR